MSAHFVSLLLELCQHPVEQHEFAGRGDQLGVNAVVSRLRQRVVDQIRVVDALPQHEHHVAQLDVELPSLGLHLWAAAE